MNWKKRGEQQLLSELKFAQECLKKYGDEKDQFEGDPEWTWEDEIIEIKFNLAKWRKGDYKNVQF